MAGLRAQRLIGAGRQHDGQHGWRYGLTVLFGLWGLLHDDVCIGPADSERGNPRPAHALRPGPGLGGQLDGAHRPVHVRGWRIHVQGARQNSLPHSHDHLQHARGTGGGLGVPNVGLDRPQQQRLFPLAAVGGQQGLRLDRVAEPGPGAVRLHDLHLLRGQPRVGQRLPDHPLLGRPVRCGQPVGRAVLVDRRAAQQRQHGVPVALCVGQPLQHENARALGEPGSVGRRGERLAPAVGGQPALAAERGEHAGTAHDRHATGERERALALPQGLHGQV
ncbi:hypothetical protein GCM10010174_35900 [Kutzneria viridogrisea]